MEESRKKIVPRPLGWFTLTLAAAVVLLALWEDSGTAYCLVGLLDADDLTSFLLLGGFSYHYRNIACRRNIKIYSAASDSCKHLWNGNSFHCTFNRYN